MHGIDDARRVCFARGINTTSKKEKGEILGPKWGDTAERIGLRPPSRLSPRRVAHVVRGSTGYSTGAALESLGDGAALRAQASGCLELISVIDIRLKVAICTPRAITLATITLMD